MSIGRLTSGVSIERCQEIVIGYCCGVNGWSKASAKWSDMVPEHRYRGAQALVVLHARYLREFVETWQRAKAAGVQLPKTDDPNYQSMEHVLRHVLRAARGYMTWMCDCLQLPDPGIDRTPETGEIADVAHAYLSHLLERWSTSLVDVPPSKFEPETYVSRWKVPYCIDSMLEHAVMHPIRHTYQLEALMAP